MGICDRCVTSVYVSVLLLVFSIILPIIMPLSPSDLEKQEICVRVEYEAVSVVQIMGLFPKHLMVVICSL